MSLPGVIFLLNMSNGGKIVKKSLAKRFLCGLRFFGRDLI
jgi:hypothetical protein